MKKYDVGSLPYELQNIALGACFLGSGGGGKLKTSFDFIDDYFSNNKKFQDFQITDLITGLEKAKPNGSGIVVAYMGAPQKMGGVKCPDAVCEGIEKFKEAKGNNYIEYIIPVEIGPVSMITACLTALEKSMRVLNVDGAGRAVPTLDLITYATKASVNPTILCSENLNSDKSKDPIYHQIKLEILGDKDKLDATSKMESLARPVLNLAEFDQKAGLVMWYFKDVTELLTDNACVPRTLTFCQTLGGAIRSMQGKNWNFPEIEELFKSQLIYPAINENYPAIKEMCRGNLHSATISTAGGFDVGVITIEDENDSERHYTIIFQNESLILWDSSYATPLITAPDLISYMIEDPKGQHVFTNGDIMEGGALKKDLRDKEIVVYGIAAPNALRESDSNKIKPEMLKPYMSVLNSLDYYGTYEPLVKEKG